MSEVRFTTNHEWIRLEDGEGVVGVTDFAQDEMGEIDFVQAPTVGMPLEEGEFVCVLESAESSMEVCAPVNGEICEVNDMLESHPDMINSDPMGDGWIFKLHKISRQQFNDLMDASEYDDFLSEDGDLSEERSLSHISLDEIELEDDDDEDEEY